METAEDLTISGIRGNLIVLNGKIVKNLFQFMFWREKYHIVG